MLLKIRKLAMIFKGCWNVQFFVCGLGGLAITQMNLLPIYPDRSRKVTGIKFEHTFISRLVISLGSPILLLLGACCYTQVLVRIVKGIARFNVIPLTRIAVLKSKNVSMHRNLLGLSVHSHTPNCIKTLGVFAPKSLPSPLVKMLESVWRNLSGQAVRKWNLDVIWSGHPQYLLSHLGGLLAQPMPILYMGEM